MIQFRNSSLIPMRLYHHHQHCHSDRVAVLLITLLSCKSISTTSSRLNPRIISFLLFLFWGCWFGMILQGFTKVLIEEEIEFLVGIGDDVDLFDFLTLGVTDVVVLGAGNDFELGLTNPNPNLMIEEEVGSEK